MRRSEVKAIEGETVGIKRTVRRTIRRTGFDVVRYPGAPAPAAPPKAKPTPPVVSSPSASATDGVPPSQIQEWRRVTVVLKHLGVDVVIDVGANEGQYARGIRTCGYSGTIVSFEPVRAAYGIAAKHAVADPLWRVDNIALGRESGNATINIAANAAQSSSILPMLERHEKAAPHATYVGSEVVQVRRLDEVLPADFLGESKAFLKIDTQGYEAEVLAGATDLLAGSVVAVQLELSLVPLYDGAPLYLDVIDQMAAFGFRLGQVIPGFSDPANGEMLQFDGVFIRQV